jgi:hypothetical protein
MGKWKWLIDYLRFYVPLTKFSLIWRRHYCRWRAAKFRPMLGAQGFWAGRDLYRTTPAVTRDLCFSGLIRGTVPFSRQLRHTRVCVGSILTRILTGQKVEMKGKQFYPQVQTLLKIEEPPVYLIIHCGGNYIGQEIMCVMLRNQIEK